MKPIVRTMLFVLFSTYAAGAVITLNPSITYQTMTGWETMFGYDLELGALADEILDQAANDLGINRVRLEIRAGVENDTDYWSLYRTGQVPYQTWRSHRYANVNDNSDPDVINQDGFHFPEMDLTIDTYILALKQRVEARGGNFYINLCYVAFTSQNAAGTQYIHDDPDEYAEFMLATFNHLQSKYDWVPDGLEIILEPDNVSQWNGTTVGNAIVKTMTKLQANGYSPDIIAPSNTHMGNAISYFDQLVQVPGAAQYMTEFSYHRYGGASDTNLQTIVNRAVQYGINTSMLEWWLSGNGYRTLHKDLKMGRNSAWQQGGIVAYAPVGQWGQLALYVLDNSDPKDPVFTIGERTKFTRQYYKFIRLGAVRIEATSDSSTFAPLGFINSNGKYVVVVKADAGGAFSIEGLPRGEYGIKYTTSSEYNRDLPDQSIGSGESLTTGIPESGVLTVYQKCEAADGGLYDLNNDRAINFGDLAVLVYYWTDCVCLEPYWCDCTDFNQNGGVDFYDFAKLAANWLTAPMIPPGPASNPNPADGATGVSRTADLNWTAGRGATSHDVYFGTSSPPPFIRKTRPLQHLTPAQWLKLLRTTGVSMRSMSGAQPPVKSGTSRLRGQGRAK